MFLLGHAVYGYIIAKLSSKAFNTQISPSLALTLGIIPDFDIFFQNLGFEHHLWTHSLLFWLPPSAMLYWKMRRNSLPLIAGIYSHMLTDALVGDIPAFYPLTDWNPGLGLPIPSAYDALLEVGGLLLALIYMYMNGEINDLFRANRRNITLAIPFLMIVTLSTLFAEHSGISIITYGFSRLAMIAITLGHLALLLVMSIGIVMGIRAYWDNYTKLYH